MNIEQLENLTAADAVAAGVAHLDAHAEHDWRTQIDTDTLDLYDFRHCVLGQIYGGYTAGVEWLGLSHDDAVMRGFESPQVNYAEHTDIDYSDIQEAWIAELA